MIINVLCITFTLSFACYFFACNVVLFCDLGTSLLFFLPTSYPITAQNMNWLIVVIAGVFICAFVNWHWNSKYNFRGPRRPHATIGSDLDVKPTRKI